MCSGVSGVVCDTVSVVLCPAVFGGVAVLSVGVYDGDVCFLVGGGVFSGMLWCVAVYGGVCWCCVCPAVFCGMFVCGVLWCGCLAVLCGLLLCFAAFVR